MIMMIMTSEVLRRCRVLEPTHVVLADQERLRGAVQGHCRYRGQWLVSLNMYIILSKFMQCLFFI